MVTGHHVHKWRLNLLRRLLTKKQESHRQSDWLGMKQQSSNSFCKAHFRHILHSTPASPKDQQSQPCDWPYCLKLPLAPSCRAVVFWFKLGSGLSRNLLFAIWVGKSPSQWSGTWAWRKTDRFKDSHIAHSWALKDMFQILPEPQFLHLWRSVSHSHNSRRDCMEKYVSLCSGIQGLTSYDYITS